MKIYLIMPVRIADPYVTALAQAHMECLEREGHVVHYPPRDAPQDDPTGREICEVHRRAMHEADRVDIVWDINSKGSHFDLGMAYALGKPINPVANVGDEPAGKSYWKAVIRGA
jgi:nucleoside 2-deoxyribosyltransferase